MKNRLIYLAREWLRGLSEVPFPNVCVCCGLETTRRGRQICSFCREERFQDANPDNEYSGGGLILPDGVTVQHALWQFDKGGILQELMHKLKYERLTGIGRELGLLVARRMREHPLIMEKIGGGAAILVPVPLHYLKYRQRGFNQAFTIAAGICEVMDIPICDGRSVIRMKDTESQTGYTIEQRIENVKSAFEIRQPTKFAGRISIIVDDVFTTGATTFELACRLREAGSSEIMIVTAAQA